MFIFVFKKLLRWILSFFFEIKVSKRLEDQIDHEGKSEDLIEKKLNKILIYRREDQVDSRTLECGELTRTHKKSWRDIPEDDTDYIQFYRDERSVIESTQDFIFSGILLQQKKVSIKKTTEFHARQELSIAKELNHHENFLPYFFGQKMLNSSFELIVMEYYETNLKYYEDQYDLRDLLMQVTAGLEYLHKIRIAHFYMNTENISVLKNIEKPTFLRNIFKITNFENAKKTRHELDFKTDIQDLGKMLVTICNLHNYQISLDKYSSHEKNLLANLIDNLLDDDFQTRPSAKEVKDFPFLWTPRDTLHFIVQISKLLESSPETNSYIFHDELKRNSKKVLCKEWWQYVDREVFEELERINRQKVNKRFVKRLAKLCLTSEDVTMRGDIISLIKTIRNLVRF